MVLRKSLLENAFHTGDLKLICKDGSKVPAHSAVLVSIPYFATKFKEDWSGTTWNLNKKLDLELPCPVDATVIQAFLRYIYGDVWSLGELDPSDASMMQDLFSLAEACGVPDLCSAIDDIVIVSNGQISSVVLA
ncbi:hypothetical protein KFL_003980090 [Klebsormidium nitens]|uniref:BTB domain-containing protein n=1 Tax=Klebsormidium nitens TaxID=105231 RepID=A0A1Y1IAS7_KLENI|nr:hypothetical protein KFL_003980090 [Klebsormidium nitens]|eukprot:GAQ88074.1 hypothetical protein KFL_003980090 [Klebsormidium nitens]